MKAHWLSLLLVAGASAQSDLPTCMEQLGERVAELQSAVKEQDRTVILRTAGQVAALAAGIDPEQPWPVPTVARRALLELTAAARAFETPLGDGKASDAHDLRRLRAACTSCHVHNRAPASERGWFPNQGNAVHGRLQVADREGKLHETNDGVVLFLEGAHPLPQPLGRPPAIVQRGRRFEPAVLAVTVGTEVAFPNDDVVFHNVFSLSKGNAFDLGSYSAGQSKTRRFDVAGLARVHCNIHSEMSAHVLVLATPLHAVSAPDGSFCIPDVADGTYTLRVWQALADEQRLPLEVRGNQPVRVEVTVRESKPRVRHLDKNGRPYRDKY